MESSLRDRGITTLLLVGAVLEIGIEPTARHAADLGLFPVVVEDACHRAGGLTGAATGPRGLSAQGLHNVGEGEPDRGGGEQAS